MCLLPFPRFPFTFPHQPSFQITPRPPFPDVTHQSPILRWEIQKQCCLFQTWESDAWYLWTVLWSAGWTPDFYLNFYEVLLLLSSPEKDISKLYKDKIYSDMNVISGPRLDVYLVQHGWLRERKSLMDSERCNALKKHQQELQFSTTESFHVLAKFLFCEETVTNNSSWDNRNMFDHLLFSDFLISCQPF